MLRLAVRSFCLLAIAVVLVRFAAADDKPKFASHPPLRALPKASDRKMPDGPARFVDAKKGDDAADGASERPWKTLAHAATKLRPGDTLYLRGGVYHEHAACSVQGTVDKPITVRSYPGELAILDGGMAEFLDAPATAWEPYTAGGPDEFRSTKSFSDLVKLAGDRAISLQGNFADSHVPLHGYRFINDFRTANEYWTVSNKLDEMQGVYCGPGLWLDKETGRVHVRLSHLHLKVLGGANYRGQTDPRRIPLVVAGPLTPLVIDNARHLRLQDLVVRGSAVATVQIIESESVALENVTIYGGTPALAIRATAGLKLLDCAVRGLSAPWSSRASHKYRGCLPYLVIIEGRLPQCRDFEFAGCEFTDNHDGLIIGTMQKLRFHHNLVDNFDDDGLYLTLSRPVPPADIHVYQNVLSRTHTMFSFAQSGEPASNEVGPGVFICRNVIDFRRRTMSQPPSSADSDASTTLADHSREGRPASDHGSPKWEPMFVYHNTVISEGPAFRNYYGAGWGGHTRATTRRIFNNIFVQADGLPGLAFGPAEDDIQADGNLHWSYLAGPSHAGDFFTKYRASKAFADSKARYAPGWAATDIFADPKFTAFSSDPAEPLDLRLSKGSPAVDAGVATPAEWPDPLRSADEGKPDLGALPAGSAMLRVGPGTSK